MSKINYSAEVTNSHGEKIRVSGGDSIDEAFKALEKAVRDRDLVWEDRVVEKSTEDESTNDTYDGPDTEEEVTAHQ